MINITEITRIPAQDHDFKTADARLRARRRLQTHEALKRAVEAGRLCSVDGCGRAHWGLGYCTLHYKRVRRNGDPLAVKIGQDGIVHTWLAELLAAPRTDDCVTWPFGKSSSGYGMMTADGRRHIASRYICEVTHGTPPTPEHHAAHSCGKGHLGCVNPRHLMWATPLENEADKLAHGTVLRGEDHGSSKLTEAQVREIVARRKAGETQRSIAGDFGIARQTVADICKGRRWASLQWDGAEEMQEVARG